MKLIKAALLSLVAAIFVLAAPPPSTQAFDFFRSPTTQVCNGNTGSSPVCKQATNKQTNPVIDVIQVTTSVFALAAGVLAVIMIIVSGLTLTTSGGNQEAVANSRKRIVNSIIGLVIVALAWVIIRFVTDQLIK